jgi:hypothetical protein
MEAVTRLAVSSEGSPHHSVASGQPPAVEVIESTDRLMLLLQCPDRLAQPRAAVKRCSHGFTSFAGKCAANRLAGSSSTPAAASHPGSRTGSCSTATDSREFRRRMMRSSELNTCSSSSRARAVITASRTSRGIPSRAMLIAMASVSGALAIGSPPAWRGGGRVLARRLQAP